MQKVAIVLPCRNSGKHLAFAVDSIINHTTYTNYRLILIEAESTDGTNKVCDDYAKKYPDKIKVVHIKNQGVVVAYNKCLEATNKDEDVYITQDDVILPKLYGRDWLTELVKAASLHSCGIVSTIAAGGVCGPEYINGFRWVGNWSIYIPRSTINNVGIFDENFSPGNGEDIDYTYRVTKAGLIIYYVNFWVDHHRSTDHSNDATPDLEKIKKRNAKYFKEKFGLR